MEPQGIARPNRARPAQLVDPATDDASRQRERLDDELHGERRRVPSAGDQFLEEGRARDRLAQVPRLRLELAAEAFDRIGVDDGARVRREHLPRSEVLEISFVHRSLLRRAARERQSERPNGAVAGPGLARTQRYERRIVLIHADAMQVRGSRRELTETLPAPTSGGRFNAPPSGRA